MSLITDRRQFPPKNIANKTLEDFINNLSLTSLTVSGPTTLNDVTVTGTATFVDITSTGTTTLNDVTINGTLELDDFIELTGIVAPPVPAPGDGRLYAKIGDDGLFWLPDTGVEVDLTATAPVEYGNGTTLNIVNFLTVAAVGVFTAPALSAVGGTDFAMINNNMTYTGAGTKNFLFIGTLSMLRSAALDADDIRVSIVRRLGSPFSQSPTYVDLQFGTIGATESVTVTVTTIRTATTNEEFNVGVANLTSALSVAIRFVTIAAMELP